jgi:hypothetical protein
MVVTSGFSFAENVPKGSPATANIDPIREDHRGKRAPKPLCRLDLTLPSQSYNFEKIGERRCGCPFENGL